ncbi:leucyl aminopeptidase [Deltaproteobacteria bacterium Smac51]|nr:leucyl aminopeptidase [Deltaproteobacteria bacterium Smac51]
MKLQFKAGALESSMTNTAIFLDDKADLKKRPELKEFTKLIAPLLKEDQFKGSYLAELPLKTDKGWLFLIGLGAAAKVTPAKIIEAAAVASKMALARNCREFDLVLPPASGLPQDEVLELCVQGALLHLYRQTEFKSKPGPKPSLKAIRFRAALETIKNGPAKVEKAKCLAEAANLARRLGDLPPNALYPESFAKEALAIAKTLKLKASVLDEKGLAKEKMGLILAVGQGSVNKPRLVTLQYKGAPAAKKPIVLVGKGITFDSGGLSLKPAAGMETMKTDMGGAAAVLATIKAAAEMKLPLNITAVIPMADNMPDGGAVHVGDVIATRSGLTVEITNTDAEGRLILAEALTWAAEMKPAMIIDVATLTGAAAVALGDLCAGLFTNDGSLRHGLMDASSAIGENLWPLPLIDDYDDTLKSQTADIMNCPSGPYGRAIVAALFLKRFIPEGVAWAHLDIAGPGRTNKARPSAPVGASGFAVRSLLRFLTDLAGRK